MNEQALIDQARAIYESAPYVQKRLGTEGPMGDKKVAVAQAGVTEVRGKGAEGRHFVVLINAWGDVLAAYKVVGKDMDAIQEMRRIPTAVEADPRWADLVQERRRFKRNFSAMANRSSYIPGITGPRS